MQLLVLIGWFFNGVASSMFRCSRVSIKKKKKKIWNLKKIFLFISVSFYTHDEVVKIFIIHLHHTHSLEIAKVLGACYDGDKALNCLFISYE